MLNTKENKGINLDVVEAQVKMLLEELGEDPHREGLLRTPHRVAKAYEFLTQGYKKDIKTVLNGAIFEERYDEMVVVKDIDFFSLCEHHLLPFYGKVHVAYIPNGKIVGLSKIPRIVEVFARRLQVQERMTQEIADTIRDFLEPKGVAVVSEARHMCMMMRGVEKQNSAAMASAMHGLFKEDARTRAEFLNLISHNRY
ncbi:MAG: GTP cyclohydrolase I FolE [Ignavibacteria bacterium]|jgi:GTP cyclohydrolase I|nr:GTP cyclohydrolase I FolE [Ignavibacteria bacterium]MCU7503944.1 GTP cyclohydrolase I FolE [Ignavibacteria bacterium]MCU7515835.1 GTP cyclohydrolase I FolE [Ignavibacteria bacterium]